MSNFRSGFLERGAPLGAAQKALRVFATGQVLDTTGVSLVKIYSQAGNTSASAAAVGATVTVSQTAHGLIAGDHITVYSSNGFATDSAKLLGTNIAITVIDANHFTYTAPGGAITQGPGSIYYTISGISREFSILSGNLPNQQVILMVETVSQVQITGNNLKLSAVWGGTQYCSLTLLWNHDSGFWTEIARATIDLAV